MSNTGSTSEDLVKQTLRTVIVLVSACVLFVGALSGAAVAITSRAFATRTESTPEPATAKAENTPAKTPAKKPQSI